MKFLNTLLAVLIIQFSFAQTWQDVGGGTNNSSHGLVTWNGKLIDLGSFNNPCNRVASWDGTSWTCLGGGVGIVARAGCVWDGKLVVVGDFWNVQQPCVGCNGVAVWDGVSWTPLGNGVNNDVLTCTVWNNELVIGGDFTQADGVPIARIAKWNGTVWESVGPIGVFDNDIRCMTEFQGELWVGGDFNNVGGCSACDGVVKYNPATGGWVGGNSGVDLVGGVNESVRVLYVNPTDGNLYMGGEFPELIDGDAGITDYNMSGVAMYDGSNWFPLGTGLADPSGQVPQAYCRAIHEYNGDVIVGGHFTTADGVPCNKIAKWNSTTQTFSAMSQGFDGVGIDEYVKSAAVWNGIFFAGGAYTQAEGGPMDFIAQWYEAPVNQPTAWMNYSSSILCGSGCIDFYDNSTNSPTSWSWTFPGSDTPSSSAQNPGTICWSSPGTYTVTLQACNAFGCNTQYLDIEVTNGASVTVNDANICTGGNATLTANPSSPGGTFLWSPGGETTQSITVSPASSTTYSVTYTMPGCTSAPAISTVTVVTGYNTSENVDACQNSTVIYPDGTNEVITASTSHSSLLVSTGGCDSTVITNVNMVTAYNNSENVNACENSVVTYPDGTSETIFANTSHTSTLLSMTGCDSIIVTNVTMNTEFNGTETVNACNGTIVIYPDGFSETITSSTSHTSNLTSVFGCDSIIVTNVTMNNLFNVSENATACENEVYVYPDGFSETITANSSHTSLLVSQSGCDSTVVTNVIMTPNYNSSENISVCSGTSYTYPDGFNETISGNTSHTSLLTSQSGCDSLVITNVSLYPDYNLSDNINVCSGASYTYPDGTVSTNITVNESHTSTLLSVNGCDSIVQTFITVTTTFNVSENFNICSGASYTYPDGTISMNITSNESHTSTLISTIGCDSLVTTNLTVNPVYNTIESVSVCNGAVFTYPDGFSETITGSTSHTSNLNSMFGCDSLVVTNVSVNQTYNQNQTVDVCIGSMYTYPDGVSELITGNTSHTSNLVSSEGCDSTIVTTISVQQNYNQTENLDVCSGSVYVYPDGTTSTNITANESHTSTLVSSAGCDSIIVTNLNVSLVLNYTENVDICAGTTYTYPDGTIANNVQSNESHVSNFVSQFGCDSVITTNLNIIPLPTVTVNNETICEGETVTLLAIPSAGGGTYSWTPGGETNDNIIVSPTSTTTYTVLYTLNGCTSSAANSTVTVTALPDNTVTVSNNQITANQNGAMYQWVDCNNGMNNIAGETNQLYAPTANGSYAVVVTMNNCESTSACETISTIGIEELSDNHSFTIYPNPTSESITISTTTLEVEVDYVLIDASGRIVLSGVNSIGQAITVKQLEAGTYTLLLNGGKSGQFAVVKQ